MLGIIWARPISKQGTVTLPSTGCGDPSREHKAHESRVFMPTGCDFHDFCHKHVWLNIKDNFFYTHVYSHIMLAETGRQDRQW